MPRNVGPLAEATHVGRVGEQGSGPYMTLWFVLEGDRITRAAYQTYGCPSAIACGSMTATLLQGRTRDQALLLTAGDLVLVLGGIPEGKEHCAQMAVQAVRGALGEH